MLVDIANGQSKRHRVTLLVINDEVDPSLLGRVNKDVEVVRFNRRPGANPLGLMMKLNRYVWRLRPDVIHLHNHKLTGLLKLYPGRTVFTVHSLNVPMRYASRSHMCAISGAVEADVRSRVPDADIRIVSNGIDADMILPRESSKLSDVFRIVQVGRLDVDNKGQDILVEALAMLVREGIDATVTFIGDGADRMALEAQVATLGLADRVVFAGTLSRREIYASLKNYDVMCHPSRFEGFGLTVAEGMAAQLPLAVPEGGGPWEVAGCGEYATLFRSGDSHSCFEALKSIKDNYGERHDRAVRSRQYVIEEYSVDRMVREYEDVYNKLLN